LGVTPKRALLSFAGVPPDRHHEYNEWHQLDHRPENLARPGVIWGERWVKSPDCDRFATGTVEDLVSCHYVNLYWFRDPIPGVLSDFQEVGEVTYQQGRRPDTRYVRRPLVQPLVPVKGYVARRAFVSAEALPLRPNRGVHLAVSDCSGDTATVGDLFQWYDQKRIPEILDQPGVAGVWTLVHEETVDSEQHRSPHVACRRVTIVFFDEDPLEVTAALPGRLDQTAPVEVFLFSSPLRVITPWEWSWFDKG
jgi:hypothetical protein